MKQAIKLILMVMLFSAVIVGAIFGYRWFAERQTAAAPLVTDTANYLTTSPAAPGQEMVDENDDLASDGNIEPTTVWPFSDRKSESKFEAKETVGYTTPTKKASKQKTTAAEKTKQTDKTKKSDKETSEETTKQSSSSSGTPKALLEKIRSTASSTKNGHPVKVDSNGISIEYKKFAVADLNGDGKDEVFLYAESNKGEDFYGYSYIVYSSDLKDVRTTMVIDEFKNVKFYKSGVYEITEGKFGFTSDAIAQSFGVKNDNSILGYDTTATPYLRYTTNGPYIAEPTEVSAADYKAAVKKLKAGGKVKVNVQDFTAANVEKL
ncbi:MAG: hypothetical protein J5847_01020 [Clostridia bacterium]|nr:hypothetical protein [Clostridia bacterium]